MCLACEEADLYLRWQLLHQIAKGEMPTGYTEDDLRAMDLPLPSEVELIDEPDGTQTLRRKVSAPQPNAFACDSPDE